MSMDFWAVKLKEGLKEEDFNENPWNLIENKVNIENNQDRLLYNYFIDNRKDNDWLICNFCKDNLNIFPKGDPIYSGSSKDISELNINLQDWLSSGYDYYHMDDSVIYTREEGCLTLGYIKIFADYIQVCVKNNLVLWITY